MDDMYCDAYAVDSLGVKYEYLIRIESNRMLEEGMILEQV